MILPVALMHIQENRTRLRIGAVAWLVISRHIKRRGRAWAMTPETPGGTLVHGPMLMFSGGGREHGAWTIATVVIAVLVAGAFLAVARGFRQAARESYRRDLFTLHEGKSAAEMFTTTLDGLPAYAFAPPLAPGRDQPIGWLWWRAEKDENGEVVHDCGWALTYRRARRAAGAPVWKSSALEVMIRR